ncbi:MAG: PAS domain S-box protein, partial [Candidatus Promineifilaceae bacterium]
MFGDANLFRSRHEAGEEARLMLQQDRVVACNRAAPDLFRCRREDLLGQSLLAFSAPSQASSWSSADSLQLKLRAALGGQRLNFEWAGRRLNGEAFTAQATLAPITTNGRRYVELLLTELPERRRHGRTIETFKLALEHAPDAVFITDLDGIINYANPAFERLYGYSPAEAVGASPRLLRPEGEAGDEDVFWAQATGAPAAPAQLLNRAKDGRLVPVEAAHSPIHDAAGALIGYLAIHRDASSRAAAAAEADRAQAALAEQLAEQTEALAQAHERLQAGREVLAAAQAGLARHEAALSAMGDSARQATASLEVDALLPALLQAAGPFAGARAGYAAEMDPNSEQLRLVAHWAAPMAEDDAGLPPAAPPRLSVAAAASAQWWAADDARVMQADDPALDEDTAAFLASQGARSALILPLVVKGVPLAEVV